MVGAGVRAYGAVLACHLALWGVIWGSLVVLGRPDVGGAALRWLWALEGLRWAVLHWLALTVPGGRGSPILRRWVAALCLLGPVFESGKAALLQGSPGDLLPDVGTVALGTAAATAACLFWELTFPDAKREEGAGARERKKQEAKKLLMRVVRYSRPDVLHLGAAFVFLSVAVLCEMLIPYYTGKVVDALGSQYDNSNFQSAIGYMALFSLGSSLFSGLRGGMFMCSLSRLNKRVRRMLFHSLLQQEIGFFEENRPGSLTSRLSSDTNKMGLSVAMNVNVLVRSVVKVSGMMGLMLGLSWQLTLLTCVEMPLLAVLQNSYNTYRQAVDQKMQDCKAEAKDLASSVVGAVRTVHSFGAGESETRRYEEVLWKMHSVQSHKDLMSAVYLLLRRMVTVGVKVAMLLYGRRLITSDQLSTGSLLAFVLYQKDMVTNVRHLVYISGEMLNSAGAAAKVFHFLDRTPKQKESGQLAPAKLEGHVTFRNVTFAYPTCPDTPALKNVTLELRPGKMTALVGPSGGGKTSCVSLLERFYEPQQGEVLLDGLPLHTYQHQYLHQKVALVSQDPVLFSGSIRHNIAYGMEDCPLEKVKSAARKANAHNFICELEQGYDTDIGECGGQLSAGQKQCVAIARALVREPQVLILDEATSRMDVDTELAMQEVLSGSSGQTVLVVAHRLKTVEDADHIIFMEDGTVVEQGTHQQLMAKGGRYHRLKEKLFADLDGAE